MKQPRDRITAIRSSASLVQGGRRAGATRCDHVAMLGLAVLALAAGNAPAADPSALKGQSWTDPPLGEVLSGADLVAECRVIVGGQWRAQVELVRVFDLHHGATGAAAGEVMTVEGFNSFEWNTAYHAMRADETVILALCRVPAPPGSKGRRATYTLPTPSSGRFPIEHGKIVGRFGGAEFLVEISADDFRAALEAYFAGDLLKAACNLGKLLAARPGRPTSLKGPDAAQALETRYLAIVLLGELRPGVEDVAAALLDPLSRDENPALREAAAHALGRMGGPHAAKVLASFLTDPDRVVARAAAEAVCEAKSSRGAVRELFAWLSRSVADETSARRKKDIEAQGRVFKFLAEGTWEAEAGPEERAAVVRGLVEMIASGRTAVCIVAARVLGVVGAKEAVPELIRLLDAEDASLREEARGALLMTTLSPLSARRDEITRWWREHRDEPPHRWVARALALAERALSENSYDGDMLGLVLLAASRDPLAPWAARKKLTRGTGWGEIPIEKFKGPLVAAFAELRLSSSSSSSRASGLRALAKLMDDFPIAGRSSGASSDRELRAAGAGFVSELLRASYDYETTPRKLALEALGREGSRQAAGRLIDELGYSPSSESKKTAAGSLRKLTGRRFGFHLPRGYDLQEERRALERWKDWHAEAGTGGRSTSSMRAPHPSAGARTRSSRTPPFSVEARLADTDPDVWLPAARELVSGGEAARGALERISRRDDARLRAVATALLGLRAERESATALEERLHDKEPFVGVQAAWALGRALRGSGSPPAKLLALAREALPKPRPSAGDGGAAVDPVDPFVINPWPEARPPVPAPDVLRTTAIHSLGKIGGDAALGILREAVASDEGPLQREALWALDAFPGGGADGILLAQMPLLGSSTREFGARALARRRPLGTVTAIAGALKRGGLWQTGALTEALVRVATPEDAPVLAELLEYPDEIASFAASRALAETPGREAAAALVKTMEGEGFAVRYYAAKALGKLGAAGRVDTELREKASAALAGRLAEFDVTLASVAAAALEHAGEPSAAAALFEYLASYEPPDARALGAVVRLGGRKGLEFALEQWKGGRWAGKYFALHAMRYASPPAGGARLSAAARAGDEAVRALVEAWRDPESPYQEVAARSLRALGGRAVPALARILRSGNAAEQRRAAELLGEVGRAASGFSVEVTRRGRVSASRALVAAIGRAASGTGPPRHAQALAFVADRALARMSGEEPSLRLRSTPGERRAACAKWSELLGLPAAPVPVFPLRRDGVPAGREGER